MLSSRAGLLDCSPRPRRLALPPQVARHVPPPASCRLLLPGAWASLRSSLSAAQEGRQAGNTQEHATQGRRPLQPGGQPLAPARYGLPRCGQRTAVRLLTGDGAADRGRRYGAVLAAAAVGRGRAAAVGAHGGRRSGSGRENCIFGTRNNGLRSFTISNIGFAKIGSQTLAI